jgi:predicted nuclease with TOPRIM domain
MLERNRVRFREAFADWLAGQAERADAADASHPDARELRVLAPENAPLEDRLALPRDLEADAARLRRELEDAFMSELIDREQALERETADLHRAYAELHGELDRVHREHAALQEDQQRLRELAPSSPRRSWRQRA